MNKRSSRRRLFHCALRLIFCSASAFAAASAATAQNAKLRAAEAAVSKKIAASGADVGIYFEMLDGTATWQARGDEAFHAASTMKIPVMIELFRQAKQGRVNLEDTVLIKNEFHSIVDGSVYTLSPTDDSETGMYKAEGQSFTLRQLCELMITASSNFATNLLIEKLGVDSIRATVHALAADGMNVLRGVEDHKAYKEGLNNTTTARGLGILLKGIAQGKAADADSCKEMIEILERQKFNEGIPAGLPAGTAVAHKTGEITKIHHDAAIVFANRPYILVILVRGLVDIKDSSALMAEVSKTFYAGTQ